MKIKRILVTLTIAAAGTVIPAVAGTSALAAPLRPAPVGYAALGRVHPAGMLNWCLTAPESPLRDHDPVFVEPCIPNDARQIWYMFRVYGVGQTTLVHSNWAVGQIGPTNVARLINNSGREATTAKYIVNFGSTRAGWHISLPNYNHGTYLSSPARITPKVHVQRVLWLRGAPASQVNQNWVLPPWHRITP